MSEEVKPTCEYCQKSFYNIYALKRHYERCKIKSETDSKYIEKQHRELNIKCKEQEYRIKELERELGGTKELNQMVSELKTQLSAEKEKNIRLHITIKGLETKCECQAETLLKYEKQLGILLDKMSTSTYNNIVAGFGEEIRVVHNDILPKCQQLITDTTNMLQK